MYGSRLPRGVRGHVDTGLGKAPAYGTVGLAVPTDLIGATPTELVLDGVRFVFQYAPDSEAPAEMTFYLPEKKAFGGAEIVSRTMHNLYTLRGAKVRDALRWSGYIDEALVRFPDAEVMFASHGWPTWGRERIANYLAGQRDTYKYIHDQTLRLAASGATPREIAEQIELPESLASSFANRGYYGTVKHNAKAVYQWYFGWYDGNPANLDPLPPEQAGAKYVEFMGGASAVLAKARASYDAGDYRWAATVLDHLVFAEPGNAEARELLAASYDQLGYRAESGPWRDVYLSAAFELRHGEPGPDTRLSGASQLLRYTPVERFFDAMAARLDGPAAEGVSLAIHFVFTDLGESHHVWIENAVLHHRKVADGAAPRVDATVRLTQDFWLRLVTGRAGVRDLVLSDEIDVDGSRADLLRFFSLLEAPDPSFAIVRP
jgi:alkyl sulfatase BDS1-like metallo-beta-lactamase superfamily hydrolase